MGVRRGPLSVGNDGLVADFASADAVWRIERGSAAGETLGPLSSLDLHAACEACERANAVFWERSSNRVVTIAQLVDAHERERLDRLVSGALTGAQIRKCLGPLMDQRIDEFAPFDLDEILEELRESAPAIAERALVAIRQMFRWAQEVGYADDDWGQYLQTKPAWRHGRSDRRTLSIEEVAEIYHSAGRLGFPFGMATRFLIATMAPMQAISAMMEEELDLGEPTPVWRAPSACKSTGMPFHVSLHSLAEEQVCLALAAKRRCPSQRVFSSTGRDQRSAWPHAKAELDLAIAYARQERGIEPMAHWALRDISSSFGRIVYDVGLDVDEGIIQASLNRKETAMDLMQGPLKEIAWEKSNLLRAWNVLLRDALHDYKKSLHTELSMPSVH